MIEHLRGTLRRLADRAGALDRDLADAGELPALELARGIVEAEKLAERLAKLGRTMRKASNGKAGKDDRR
jgi:hypothetical protein